MPQAAEMLQCFSTAKAEQLQLAQLATCLSSFKQVKRERRGHPKPNAYNAHTATPQPCGKAAQLAGCSILTPGRAIN
jgi:hypothetical protein